MSMAAPFSVGDVQVGAGRRGTEATTTPPLLDVIDLRVTLPLAGGPADALRDVSFTVAAGETVGLIGESGSGKSMTALALMRLLPERAAVSGHVRFGDVELLNLDDRAMSAWRGNRIAMVFQEPMTALNPLHTIGDQVAEPLRVHRGMSRASARAEALRLLERVRLADAAARLDAYPHQLSGGQRQRVTIAMALACGPQLVIADEPTTALDVRVQRGILDLLDELVAERAMALLLISHDLGVMADRVSRLLVMYGGTVVEAGPTADVFARLAHPYSKGLFGARPRVAARRTDDMRQRLATIPGRVPSLANMPRGCPFEARCGWAIDACGEGLPAMVPVADRHGARCIRLDEIAAGAAPHVPLASIAARSRSRSLQSSQSSQSSQSIQSLQSQPHLSQTPTQTPLPPPASTD